MGPTNSMLFWSWISDVQCFLDTFLFAYMSNGFAQQTSMLLCFIFKNQAYTCRITNKCCKTLTKKSYALFRCCTLLCACKWPDYISLHSSFPHHLWPTWTKTKWGATVGCIKYGLDTTATPHIIKLH